MWNQFRTDDYEGTLAETVTIAGHNGELIHAYLSRPLRKERSLDVKCAEGLAVGAVPVLSESGDVEVRESLVYATSSTAGPK